MSLAILIPAAGNSSRLGQPKQLVKVKGQPLLQNRINLCTAICQDVYCVLGANAQQIKQQVEHEECQFLYNPQWQKGLSHSIALGLSQLPPHISAVMIVLADQWALSHEDLQTLVKLWQHQPDKIHAASYNGDIGVPAIFPNTYFDQIKQLSPAGGGAKPLLKKYRNQIITVPLENGAFDLDVPQHLKQYLEFTENVHDHSIY